MDTIYTTLSNQPVWLQVVIGLAIFFVGIPLLIMAAMLFLGTVSRTLGFITDLVFFTRSDLEKLILIGSAFAVSWLSATELAPRIAYQLVLVYGLSPQQFDSYSKYVGIALLLLVVVVSIWVAWRRWGKSNKGASVTGREAHQGHKHEA